MKRHQQVISQLVEFLDVITYDELGIFFMKSENRHVYLYLNEIKSAAILWNRRVPAFPDQTIHFF